jgi:hypothetical protein
VDADRIVPEWETQQLQLAQEKKLSTDHPWHWRAVRTAGGQRVLCSTGGELFALTQAQQAQENNIAPNPETIKEQQDAARGKGLGDGWSSIRFGSKKSQYRYGFRAPNGRLFGNIVEAEAVFESGDLDLILRT